MEAVIDVTNLDSATKASRQAKKLHLRSAGFKARNMPARNRTPSNANLPSWTSPANVSDTKAPNSVLREISNSTKRRKKHARPRIEDAVLVFSDENLAQSPKLVDIADLPPQYDELPERSAADSGRRTREQSPSNARCESPSRTKSPRKQTPSRHRCHQSANIETSSYIEHLEAELAAVQTQLAAMTSPTVMQARSHKMRALNAETRALQDEVATWERKFHERVQEEISERTNIETALKSRVRLLEGDVTDYTLKIQDLQAQLDKDQVTIAATESANFELERRIDAISGLLTSPKKSELERSSSTRQRHARQRSMLPRFPTTGSLNLVLTPCVKEEGGQPITPTTTTSDQFPNAQLPGSIISPDGLDHRRSSDQGCDLQRTISGEAVPQSARSKRASWAHPDGYFSVEPGAVSTSKPSRRMRRFHAGIVMPKPLLLPSTNSYSYAANAPCTSPPKQSSPQPEDSPSAITDLLTFAQMASARNFECLLSTIPGNGRRRALTSIEDVAAAMRRASNPFLSPIPFPVSMAAGVTRPSTSASTDTATSSGTSNSDYTIVGDVSSLGPAPIGRNLFDELQRVRGPSTIEADCSSFEPCDSVVLSDKTRRSSSFTFSSAGSATLRLRKRAQTSHRRSFSDTTALSEAKDVEEDDDDDDLNEQIERGLSWAVGEVFRQTYDTSRQCLQHAQSLALDNSTFQRLQWWLVQLFLGPMMTKRMMATAARQGRRQKRTQHLELLSGSTTASRSFARRHLWEPSIWVEGMNEAEMQVSKRDLPMNWIQKHSPWLWIRFSIALLFAIGAAIRDGPSVVMGLQEQEDKIE